MIIANITGVKDMPDKIYSQYNMLVGEKSDWSTINPILQDGQPAKEYQLSEAGTPIKTKFKIGNGVSPWNELEYASGAESEPGMGQITLILSPPSLVFFYGTDGVIASEKTVKVLAFYAGESTVTTIGAVSTPSGITCGISGNGTSSASLTFAVSNSATAEAASISIPITVSTKLINMTVSIDFSQTGESTSSIDLVSDRWVVAIGEDGEPKDSSNITVSALLQNITGSVEWSVTPSDVVLTGTDTIKTLSPSVFKTYGEVQITATIGDLFDSVSIISVKDSVQYRAEVRSSNGNIFTGNSSTILTVHLFRNDTDISSMLADSQCHWTKVNYDGSDDAEWNAAHSNGMKSLTVESSDFIRSSTFCCEVDYIN